MSRDYIQWQEKLRGYIIGKDNVIQEKINTPEGLKLFASFKEKDIGNIRFECLNKTPKEVVIEDKDFDWYQNDLELLKIKKLFATYKHRCVSGKNLNFGDLNFWCNLMKVEIEDILKEEIIFDDFKPIKTNQKESNTYHFYVSENEITYLEAMLENLDTSNLNFDFDRKLPFPLIIHMPTNSVLYLQYDPYPKEEKINYFMVYSSYTRTKKMRGNYRYGLYSIEFLSNSFSVAYNQFLQHVEQLYTTYKKQFANALLRGFDKSIYKELSYLSELYEDVIHELDKIPAKQVNNPRKDAKEKYIDLQELNTNEYTDIDEEIDYLELMKMIKLKPPIE